MKKSLQFSEKLLAWYQKNKRDLPWRKTKNPYKIWLSEIMLQQTQVAQGLPYYLKFIDAFPTVFDLAKASQDEVLKLWQGLGYYSRARNLHTTAKYVSEELNGVFPDNYKDLLKLKGIGDYTASAIASICYGEAVAVVDGNVYRVLSRYFDVDTPINSTAGKKEFKALAEAVLDEENPEQHNQSIMEFGAMQCKPKKPLCGSCPLNEFCKALQLKKTSELPVKLKKTKVKKRHLNYLVFLSEDGKTSLRKRTGKGIWQGLYEFPFIESKRELKKTKFNEEYEASADNLKFRPLSLSKCETIELFNPKPITHKLSHQHLFAKFWIIKVKSIDSDAVSLSELETFPVPVLIENFIKSHPL